MKEKKNISALSQANNLNKSDYIFNRNNSNEKNNINDKNENFFLNSNSEKKFFNNERNINKKISNSNKLIYSNNLNSNGGKIEMKDEDINDSSDEEEIRPINKFNINVSFEKKIKKEQKKNINIPPLNFKKLINELKKNSIKEENSELNTHDSPTHESSFSLFKTHGKYFN